MSVEAEDFVPNSEKYAARVRERIASEHLWKSAVLYALLAIYELLKERLPSD